MIFKFLHFLDFNIFKIQQWDFKGLKNPSFRAYPAFLIKVDHFYAGIKFYSEMGHFLLNNNSASIFFWETSKIDDSCFGSETDKNRKRIEETANEQIRIQSLDQIKKVTPL